MTDTATAPETETTSPKNAFGFVFIEEDKVPPPPRKRDVDTERWATLKLLLEEHPNKWVLAKEYDSAQGAQSKASQINNDNTKEFLASEGWEARSEVNRKVGKNGENDKGISSLYLCFKGEAKAPEADAE